MSGASVAGAEWLKDAALQRVLAALNADGDEARVAGGAVRNALLGEAVADVDVATTVGSSRVDLQACKLEYSIVSPK